MDSSLLSAIPDFAMFDVGQSKLLDALEGAHGLFSGADELPALDSILHRASQQLLRDRGEAVWRDCGGLSDGDGRLTLQRHSPAARDAARAIARRWGGFRYRDAAGQQWAVRLMPAGAARSEYCGFAIALGGGKPAICRRAAQLLWMLSLQVRLQRSTRLLLPDVQLRQVVWGTSWPQDWRRELFRTLSALTALRMQVLRLDSGLLMQPEMVAVAVSMVRREGYTKPHRQCSYAECQLRGASIPHGHLFVSVEPNFLGALKYFATRIADNGATEFDFSRLPNNERAKSRMEEARRCGALAVFNVPSRVLGPAKWAQLNREDTAIINALVREITRPGNGRRTSRPDGADVVPGNAVPVGSRGGITGCPHLSAGEQYVAFNGNGKRRGLGYTLLGRSPAFNGWLSRFGIERPTQMRRVQSVANQLLQTISKVGQLLGVIAVAYDAQQGSWLTLAQLLELWAGGHCLDGIHMRFYGPVDYHVRLRNHFEQQLHGGESRRPPPTVASTPPLSAVMLQGADIKQQELAAHLGISQPYVSKLLRGVKPWPNRLLIRATDYVARCGSNSSHGDLGSL